MTPPPASPPPSDPAPKRFERSRSDRMIGGVCGGLARYFGIDPTLVRIGAFGLVFLGGVGLVLYAAALLFVGQDDSEPAAPAGPRERMTAVGLVAVIVVACLLVGDFGFFAGSAFLLSSVALAGLAVWWLASGERPTGGPGDIVRRAALGVGLLTACAALAAGSFFAAGLGGGVVVAGLVIAAGAGLVAAAFVGGARWMVLPALAVALPLAFVSAAGIDLDGGFGERHVRPGTVAEVKDGYRLGGGELVVDLRDVDLPPGDRRLSVDMGMGHALVLVPDDVCVATSAQIGMGAVDVLDRSSGGFDLDWDDARRAPAGTPRLILDADVGLGYLEVRHRRSERFDDDRHDERDERNLACARASVARTQGDRSGAHG